MVGLKRQDGNAIVEATIVFPIMIMIIIVLFYAALFLCQRANLQANLQTSLIYYKNLETDTNVVIDQNGSASILNLHGSKYDTPKVRFPYRNFFMSTKNQQGDFQKLFTKIAGQMFFASVSDVQVDYKTRNFVVYQDITATATQKVKIPINSRMLGIEPDITIGVEARVVVTDPDEFARTSQLIGDLVDNTKLGEIMAKAGEKVASGYKKLKEVLLIN